MIIKSISDGDGQTLSMRANRVRGGPGEIENHTLEIEILSELQTEGWLFFGSQLNNENKRLNVMEINI